VKLEDLRKQARSGITPEAREKPKRQRKHVQEMDLREVLSIQVIERDRDILKDVEHLRVKRHDREKRVFMGIDIRSRTPGTEAIFSP